MREYFSMGRHANVDYFCLCQSYARIVKHLIRPADPVQIGLYQLEIHVYNNHVNSDIVRRICCVATVGEKNMDF